MEDQSELQDAISKLQEQLTDIQVKSKDAITLSKNMNKQITKLIKQSNSKRQVKKASTSENKKSGFAKPTQLVPELYTFLGIPDTELLSRTDVTRHINKYVKDNNLQKPDERKVILPDEKLGKLLNVPDDIQLTYFNLQRYMKHLFVTDASKTK